MSFTRTITWSDGSGGATPLSSSRLNTAFQEVANYADTAVAAVAYDYLPTDLGFISWNYDPVYLTNTGTLTAGQMYVTKVKMPAAASITNLHLYLGTAGATLTSGQNFAALYQNGTKLAITADQTTAWAGATGLLTMPLVGGPISTTAGAIQVCWWANGTTPPSFERGASIAVPNGLLSAANSRFARADTGLTTTAPSTLATLVAISTAYWVAVS